MAIVQISKIQVRTGAHSDLPQLDIGELGFATDTKTVHIGNDTVLYPPDPNNPEPSNTRLLTDSPDCVINASQIRGVITLPVTDTKITGGTNGQYLQTDGTGNLTWSTVSGGGGGSPGGSTTQIQFNDSGSFGGNSKLTFNKSTGLLSITGNITATNITGTLLTSIQPSITSVGTLANLTVAANGNINLGGELKITNNNLHGGSDYAGMITLTTTVSGASNTSKFIRLNKTGGLEILNSDYSSTIFTLTDSGNIIIPMYYMGSGRYLTEVNATTVDTLHSLTVDGTVNFSGTSNVTLGSIGNIHINGGTNGQVLKTDGSGGLSWTTITANGNSVSSYGNSDVDLRIASYLPTFTGNLTSGNANLGNSVVANYFIGSGAGLTSVIAVTAGTVTTAAQPNITSVGTLTSLTVTGNVSSSILNATGNISGLRFYGNGIGLTNIPAGNIVGYVTNATNANYAATAGTATTVDWTGIGNVPTTVSGYGITDIYGPLFSAFNSSNQNLTTGTANLIYSTATINTSTYYNTTTGIFTPLVSGWYQVNASLFPELTAGTGNASFFLAIYKNGTLEAIGAATTLTPSWGTIAPSSASKLIYLNGSTDTLNCKLNSTITTGTWRTGITVANFFQASWTRP